MINIGHLSQRRCTHEKIGSDVGVWSDKSVVRSSGAHIGSVIGQWKGRCGSAVRIRQVIKVEDLVLIGCGIR